MALAPKALSQPLSREPPGVPLTSLACSNLLGGGSRVDAELQSLNRDVRKELRMVCGWLEQTS